MKITVIIPTLNRPDDLKRALVSVSEQTAPPHEVLVVDQSTDRRTDDVVTQVRPLLQRKSIRLLYVWQEEKSLVKARNRGLDLAEGDIVSFFDDDVFLSRDYLKEMLPYFETDADVVGVSGNVFIEKKPEGAKWTLRKVLMRLFLLSGFNGRLTASGFGFPIFEREIRQSVLVEMLPGCDMSFRRAALGGERFDEWFTGYSFREDVDFSYRMSKKGKLVMVPEAKLYHHYSPQNRLDVGRLKRMEIRNYCYIFRKHRRRALSALLFAYSLFGLLLIDGIEYLSNRNEEKLEKFRASVSSVLDLLRNRSALY